MELTTLQIMIGALGFVMALLCFMLFRVERELEKQKTVANTLRSAIDVAVDRQDIAWLTEWQAGDIETMNELDQIMQEGLRNW